MRQFAELNAVGIYRKMRINGVQVQKFTGGNPVISNGILLRSSVTEPLYSYAKNFKKFSKEFSLFIWTSESDQAKIEKHFDKVVKGLKREEIMQVLTQVSNYLYVDPKY